MKTKYMKKFATIKDYIKTKNDRDFPGGPVVKTPHFHPQGARGSIPGRETKIPHVTWCGKKKTN